MSGTGGTADDGGGAAGASSRGLNIGGVPEAHLRRAAALAFLALGGFAIGCSEFAGMGLLPAVARDVLPAMAVSDPDTAAARASVFVWGYALGVVIGAPVIGILSAKIRQKAFLLSSLAAMGMLTVGTAVAGSLPLLVGLRLAAGLPHGAYLGVAAIVASRLMGQRHQARGVAVVLGGLTLANLAGAPAGTWLAQYGSWRMTYLGIASLFALSALGLITYLRSEMSECHPPASLRQLSNGRLWKGVLGFALVNAGLFAVMTFIVPIAVHGRPSPLLAAVVLAVAGLGMTVGNYVGGVVSDRRPNLSIPSALVVSACGFVLLCVGQATPAMYFCGFGLVGFALGFAAPYTQVWLTRAAPRNPQFGSSMNSVCGNIGSAVGGAAAGLAIGMAGSASAAIGVGAVFVACGALPALLLARIRREP